MSAVSNRVIPRSIARSTTARDASRSMRPPKLLQPRPTTETRSPDLPRLRSSIPDPLPSLRLVRFRQPEKVSASPPSAPLLALHEAPQHGVDAGLPAPPPGLEPVHHLGVEADVDRPLGFPRQREGQAGDDPLGP